MRKKIISTFLSISIFVFSILFCLDNIFDNESNCSVDIFEQVALASENDNLQTISIDKNLPFENVIDEFNILENDSENYDIAELNALYNENKNDFFDNIGYFCNETDDELFVYSKFQLKRLIVKGKINTNVNAKNIICCYSDYSILYFDTEEETAKAYDNLILEKDIEVVIDRIVTETSYADTDYQYSSYNSWGSKAIDIAGYNNFLSDKNYNNRDIVVIVIDSGINTNHKIFEDRFLRDDSNKIVGYSFVDSSIEDTNGHGTHVAGIICDNTPSNVKIIPIRALNSDGSGSLSNIIMSLDKAKYYANEYKTEYKKFNSKGYDVVCVNMSLSSTAYSDDSHKTFCSEFDDLRCLGVLTTVAAGNNSSDVSDFLPANCENAIVVSALCQQDINNDFEYKFDFGYSNYGSTIDICAPGTRINSAYRGGNSSYKELDGTSMSTPFVSAALALIYSEKLNTTSVSGTELSEIVENKLINNCTLDYGEVGFDEYYGYGILNLRYFNVEKTLNKISINNLEESTCIQFKGSISVNLTFSDPSYDIYYNLDGEIPTISNSKKYTSQFSIDSSKSVSFIAYKFNSNGEICSVSKMCNVVFFNTTTSINNYLSVSYSDNKISILKYYGHFENIQIPSTIYDFEVVEISDNAFLGNVELQDVILPSTCKKIGKKAFSGCVNLKSVDASGVTTVGDSAFLNCLKLEKIKIQNLENTSKNLFENCSSLTECNIPNVTKIDDYCFKYCSSLKNFEIGENVKSVGVAPFLCSGLTSINLNANNKYLYTDGLGLYNSDSLLAFISNTPSSYEIKKSVSINGYCKTITKICDYVFYKSNVNILTIPNKIMCFGKNCFAYSDIGIVEYYAETCSSLNYYIDGTYYPIFEGSKIKIFNINSSVSNIPEQFFYKIKIDKLNINRYDIQFDSLSFAYSTIDIIYLNFSDKIYLSDYFTNASNNKVNMLYYTNSFYLNSKIYDENETELNEISLGSTGEKIYYVGYKNSKYLYSKNKNALFDIVYEVSNFESEYDGNYHNIQVTVKNTGNYKIAYSLDGENYNITKYNTDSNFKNSTDGQMIVYFKITSAGYKDTYGFGYLKINKIKLDISINDATGQYGDVPMLSSVGYKIEKGKLVGDDILYLDYHSDASKNSDVGNYYISAQSSNKNYDCTFTNGTYTITKREITYLVYDYTGTYGKLNFDNENYKIYDGSIVNNDNLNIKLIYGDGSLNQNAGDYAITLVYDNNNYNVSCINGNLHILKRKIEFTINDSSSIYGDEVKLNGYKITSSMDNYFINNDETLCDFKIKTDVSSSTSIGTNYEIYAQYNDQCDEMKNYDISVIKGKYSVIKRGVVIKLNDASSVYGDDIKFNGYDIVDGNFVFDDEKLCNIKLFTDAKNNSSVGDYEITEYHKEMQNYTITITYKGKYTITKRPVVYYINDASSTYGNEIKLKGFYICEGNFVSKNDEDKCNFNISVNATNLSDVNKYKIEYKFNALTNYNISVKNEPYYTINKREITINIKNCTGIYGDPIEFDGYSIYSGSFIGNDENDFVVNLNTTADNKSNIGNYDISANLNIDEMSNYHFIINKGTYTINKRDIEISLREQCFNYGDKIIFQQMYDIENGKIVNNDALNIAFQSNATNRSNVGEYILNGECKNENYNCIVNSGTLTIKQRVIKIQILNQKLQHFEEFELDQTKYKLTSGTIVSDDDIKLVLDVKLDRINLFNKYNSVYTWWGEYEITGTYSNENYEIQITSGTLKVEFSILDTCVAGVLLIIFVIFILIISSGRKRKRRKRSATYREQVRQQKSGKTIFYK